MAVAYTNLLKLRLPARYQIHNPAGSPTNWTLWVTKAGVGVERQEVMKMEGGVLESQGFRGTYGWNNVYVHKIVKGGEKIK